MRKHLPRGYNSALNKLIALEKHLYKNGQYMSMEDMKNTLDLIRCYKNIVDTEIEDQYNKQK